MVEPGVIKSELFNTLGRTQPVKKNKLG